MPLGIASGNAAAAVLFMQGGLLVMDVTSAVNSSPWTAESFGGDPNKANACREYVLHAITLSAFYGLSSSLIAGSWWPIVGTVLASVYMYWLYNRALGRAVKSGSTSWSGNGTSQ